VKDKLIKAALQRFKADKLESEVNLSIYLERVTGISDHPNVVQDVVELTKKIANADECIKILQAKLV
jgi:hypothetical protein|tara:strand:- start:213 stop:413 length:201 start_codon:yes stop_codon:yes gene_type:complete